MLLITITILNLYNMLLRDYIDLALIEVESNNS